MSALRKILVVDDDPVVGKSFTRVLSQDKGYVVITAENAAQALEKLREQEYDLVFTDIKMPGMDGVELAERVKAKRPWTPVVIVTGYGSTANEHRARSAGVSGFLNKPLSPEMIEDSAEQALRTPVPVIPVQQQAKAIEEAPVELIEKPNGFKSAALFLAAPFIGLVFALLLPVVGISMLAWTAGKALVQSQAAKRTPSYLKNVALFVFAPFIGLAYAVMLPVVGTAMLVWAGVQALRTKSDAE